MYFRQISEQQKYDNLLVLLFMTIAGRFLRLLEYGGN